jgi:hypothetical protein
MAISPNISPRTSFWRLATAPDTMDDVLAASGINMTGWRKMNVHIVPLDDVPANGALPESWSAAPSNEQADIRIWVWNDQFQRWVDTGITKSTSGGGGLHFTFDCNGCIVFLQLTSSVTPGESVSMFVSAFDQAD